MTTGITISGSRISRTLAVREIENIKSAKCFGDIDNIWDRIADFFCGTQKQDVKKKLFDIIHGNNVNTKINDFYQLQLMAIFYTKGKFEYYTEKTKEDEVKITLIIDNIKIDDFIVPLQVVNKNNDIIEFTTECDKYKDNTLLQLKKDILRSNIYILSNEESEKKPIKDIDTLRNNNINNQQREILNIALTQIGTGDILFQLQRTTETINLLINPQKEYQLIVSENLINIKHNIWNEISLEEMFNRGESYLKWEDMIFYIHTDIVIDKNGKCSIPKTTLSFPST